MIALFVAQSADLEYACIGFPVVLEGTSGHGIGQRYRSPVFYCLFRVSVILAPVEGIGNLDVYPGRVAVDVFHLVEPRSFRVASQVVPRSVGIAEEIDIDRCLKCI